jgi:hypothetical protein
MDNLEVNKIVNKILKLKKEQQTQKVKEQIQKLQQKLK